MIKRTVEISQRPVHLTVRDRQLLLLARDEPAPALPAKPDNLLSAIPCEDIGLLLVEHAGVTYSHAALLTLIESDAAVVLCGRDHLPAGLLLPLGEHTQVVWRIHDQLAMQRPLRKQLWRQLVVAKIRAQAANLPAGSSARSRLLSLAREVRSGDPTNVEAQAARVYWAAWRNNLDVPAPASVNTCPETTQSSAGGPPRTLFRRNPDGPPPNNLLNYGYAVLRAALARAIVSAGLLPALGIHHANRSNAFCLADDLVEPLRPLVDDRVAQLVRDGLADLTPPVKRALLELLAIELRTGEQSGPLMVALHRYVASLVHCLTGEARRLTIPVATGADSPAAGESSGPPDG